MYLLEYIGVFGSLTVRILLADHRQVAIRVAVLTSVVWIMFSFYFCLYGILFLNVMYVVLDTRTILRWKAERGDNARERKSRG